MSSRRYFHAEKSNVKSRPAGCALLAFLLFFLCASIQVTAQPLSKIGVNLDDAGAFVNIMHHTNRYTKVTQFDSFGWPRTDFDLVLIDGRPVAEWANVIDDPEEYRIDYSGRYKGSFAGVGTVTASGTAATIDSQYYDANSNSTFFDVVVGGSGASNHGMVFLQFRDTRPSPNAPSNTGITKLRIHRPGYPLSNTQTFTNEYLALCRAANFQCYRFYNVQNIWDGEPTFPAVTKWENRKTPMDASQRSMSALNGKRDGWCWEYIVELANILNKDIWINVHMACDSEYVFNLATFLNEELNDNINIYVESSNEVWSATQATHGPYNQAQAVSRAITFDDNHAYRTVELSKWFTNVFGVSKTRDRIRVVMAGQQGYPGRTDNHMNFIQKRFGAPNQFIYATSSTVYFGSNRAADLSPDSINIGMVEEISNQVSNSSASGYRPIHIAKAKTWNLKGGCTSYEGGPHLPAGGGSANLSNQILSHRTEGMGNVLKFNFQQGWFDIGGGLAMYFGLASGYNRYGCWGLTDDYTKPYRNYKMRAMQEMLQTPSSVGESTPSLFSVWYDASTQNLTVKLVEEPHISSTVQIYSFIGQRINPEIQSATPNQLVLDVSHVTNGLYVVYNGNRSFTFLKY